MGLVRCDRCGNCGCFEIVEARYSDSEAIEKMQCCRCGSITTLEMW